MRTSTRIMTALAILALVGALVGCTGAASGTGTGPARSGDAIVSDESPVPDGMPVMYEFFTLT